MGLIDTLVAMVVLVVFGYLVWTGLKKKNPLLAEKAAEFSPTQFWKSEDPPKINNKMEKKQVWTDNRSMI